MKKYNIVRVSYDYKTNIIKTFSTHGEAIEYLTNSVDKEYKKDDGSFKIYYTSKDEITVHYVGILTKGLHAKYFILDFIDDTYHDCMELSEEELFVNKKK
jgi:hypothetical protein